MIRKLQDLNNAFETVLDLDVTSINKGYCFVWSWIAYELLEDCKFISGGGHAGIKYRGQYYDSESLQGETSYYELRCLRDGYQWKMEVPKVTQTRTEFYEYWSDPEQVIYPNHTRLNDNKMLNEIRKYVGL